MNGFLRVTHPQKNELFLFTLSVQKPYFPELVPPVYLFKDSQARLPCKPAGEPQPTVKWFKDGVAISYGQNASYRLQANGTLIIDKVENGNAGKYTCMAENFLGKANVTARGILLGKAKLATYINGCDDLLH